MSHSVCTEIKISLFSDDAQFIELCKRTVMTVAEARTWRAQVIQGDVNADSDVAIYDFSYLAGLTSTRKIRYQDIVIVGREQIEFVQSLIGHTLPCLLLKPIAEPSLRLALDESVKRCRSEYQEEKRTLLQLTLEAVFKLQEYDHDRVNFLARGMHDFRAPLTALKGYCGLLLDRELNVIDSHHAEILKRMQHSINRLSRMADGMLQLSVRDKLDAKLDLQDADLAACVNQAISEVAGRLQEKDIQLAVDLEPAPEGLVCDLDRIEQVLVNILDNACKFTPRRGSIEIRGCSTFWEPESSPRQIDRRMSNLPALNAYRLDISDSGPGIPIEQLPKIFEEYTSFSGGRDRSGVGLGLAISKLLISQHKGKIWAECAGNRTVFSFILPVSGAGTNMPAHLSPLQNNTYVDQLPSPAAY